MKTLVLAFATLVLALTANAQVPAGSKIYVDPEKRVGGEVQAAAMHEKLPVVFVTDKDVADFVFVYHEHTSHHNSAVAVGSYAQSGTVSHTEGSASLIGKDSTVAWSAEAKASNPKDWADKIAKQMKNDLFKK